MVGDQPLFRISIKNEQEFQKQINTARKYVRDLTEPFKRIAKDFYRSEQAIFKLTSAGGFDDFKGPKIQKGPFEGYTPYQKFKEITYQRKGGYPLLFATGRLAVSVTTPDSPESICRVAPGYLVIGTSTPYAVYSNSDNPRKKMPQRKFLFIAPESRFASNAQFSGRLNRWVKIIQTYVIRSLGATVAQAKDAVRPYDV